MKNIILDTDIGDDIDDALALSYLCKSKDINLVGITTVYMNTYKRALLTEVILQALNKTHIPVVAGIGKGMTISLKEFNRNVKKHNPRQMDILKDIKISTEPLKINVLDFLNDITKRYEGDITLLTIGALTNIGTFLKKYPNANKRIKEIVTMGGCFFSTISEWNIICDPEAASIVVESGIPIRMVGLDVTLQCRLEENNIKRIERYKTDLCKLLGKLIRLWQKEVGRDPFTKRTRVPNLHDPLAAIAINHPEVLKFEPFCIKVETKGKYTRGMTVLTSLGWNYGWKLVPGCKSNVLVATEVNVKKVIDIFMDAILR
jgi:purine nucleosidase/pyrimidine-specific ribonucleoside hydrolase